MANSFFVTGLNVVEVKDAEHAPVVRISVFFR
jgi:hypothetical protein